MCFSHNMHFSLSSLKKITTLFYFVLREDFSFDPYIFLFNPYIFLLNNFLNY